LLDEFGLELMTKVCALEWAPHGVTVNTVAPIVVDTPLTRKVIDTPKKLEGMLRRIPAARFASCGEVAGAVLYLASTKMKRNRSGIPSG
jgi:NAD(P)-dependent dehydrogenase (short-subunit alcohol dehydrogenase family)